MPQFMDIHTEMKGITKQQLEEAHRADAQIEKSENVHFIKAWADPATGRVFCLSEAPNREAVQRVHERAGHKANEIYEIPLSVE